MQTSHREHDEDNSVNTDSGPDYIAKVTSITGNANFLIKGNTEWSILKPNFPLYSGDIIKTEKESRVELSLIDYGYINISEQSLLQISVKLLPDSTMYAACNLKQGSILANIKKLVYSKHFVVRTPTVLAAIRGTSFRTSVDRVTGESEIQVLNGRVGVRKRIFKKINQNVIIQDSILAQNVMNPIKDFSAANIVTVMNDLDDDEELEMESIRNETSETMIVRGRGVVIGDTEISTTVELSSDDMDLMKSEFSNETITKVLQSLDPLKSSDTDTEESHSLPPVFKSDPPETLAHDDTLSYNKRKEPIEKKQFIKENKPIDQKQKQSSQKKQKKVDTINYEINENENTEKKVPQPSSLNPEDAKAYSDRGTVYFNLKRYDEALADYSKAISINPDFLSAYVKRGNVYATLKLYNEAIKDYTKAISIDPEYALAYYHRGLACKNLIQKNTITVLSGVTYHNRDQSYIKLKNFNEVIINLKKYLNLCSDKNGILAKNAREIITKLNSH